MSIYPKIAERKVDFPDPTCPITETNSPWLTLKFLMTNACLFGLSADPLESFSLDGIRLSFKLDYVMTDFFLLFFFFFPSILVEFFFLVFFFLGLIWSCGTFLSGLFLANKAFPDSKCFFAISVSQSNLHSSSKIYPF